jgi:hypothetical protein
MKARPDHHGHAPHGRRHPVSGSRGRLSILEAGGSLRSTQAARRASHSASCSLNCERRGRRADHHLFRRRQSHRRFGSRHLAEGDRA